MNEEKLIEIVIEILKNAKKQIPANISMNMDLRNDLGLDSFNLAEMTVRIEDITGIDVFEAGVISTLQDAINRLK
ncbi:MAG: hypothetical protein A2W91_07240 [Bacteroidetes bacterium GWF2_38_335]|nr:MAG: hypothetical protein A2W91_07240 [Bacteroidetes bacterium GWF2_38_335]OFY77122.1 MAG: hypothetical protein A2281_14475 [Bacteroidetes bacterium RIFOXYA12_FULL_38_20]HBS85013.1 acyl carrier protein [Bacteroidales bacterium]